MRRSCRPGRPDGKMVVPTDSWPVLNSAPTHNEIDFQAVTADNLADLERFSRGHGKFRYCSCMRWRMTSAEFKRSNKPKRIEALRDEVANGRPTGVLAYADGTFPSDGAQLRRVKNFEGWNDTVNWPESTMPRSGR